ncbi:uncharacterized protein [Lepeophtheirus salmonis]|uniref:uncharacterized protein n=1 Tax=Lepeophtheirus salmonis TaxID=72036 RepID=UPI001AE332A8|nr:uncharacterized protein LOC121124393 [Lepeophtheirus salmonis]
MSFKCNGHTTCKIPESQNFEVELNYTCEPLQIKQFISDPQSFKDILDFGLRQLNISATDKNQNILSASYSTAGNDNGTLVFSGFSGSTTLDIFDNLKSISENDFRINDEIEKGFEFLMHNYIEFNLSLSPRYPSFRFDHLDIGGIYCKDLLNISLCKFRYPREKGIQGLKSSFGECNEPFATRSTMEKFEDSQCTYQLPQLEWRTLMTGHSNSTLLQVKSSLEKELWRYLDPNGNYVFKIEIGISYINKDLQKTKFNLSLVWKQGNDIYGQRNDTKIFWNELFFFKGSKYWKTFTGLSSEKEQISFGEIFYLDDISQYSDEEIVFTLYGNYYPNKQNTWTSIVTTILTSMPLSNTSITQTEATTLNISSSVRPTIMSTEKKETTTITSTAVSTTSSSGDPISTVTPTEKTCTQYEPWSECSVSCGIGGIKRRILQCGSDLKIESEECSTEACTEGKLG